MKKKLEQFRLPTDLVGELKAYSDASGMDKTEIVIMALREKMAESVTKKLAERAAAVKRLGEISSDSNPVVPLAVPGDGSSFLKPSLSKAQPKGEVDPTSAKASPPSRKSLGGNDRQRRQ